MKVVKPLTILKCQRKTKEKSKDSVRHVNLQRDEYDLQLPTHTVCFYDVGEKNRKWLWSKKTYLYYGSALEIVNKNKNKWMLGKSK